MIPKNTAVRTKPFCRDGLNIKSSTALSDACFFSNYTSYPTLCQPPITGTSLALPLEKPSIMWYHIVCNAYIFLLSRAVNKLDKAPSKKAKTFCLILVIITSLICIIAGCWKLHDYKKLKTGCTSEAAGLVIHEGYWRINKYHTPETKYTSGKYWRQIEVETDGNFKLKNIYARRGKEKKGDSITIHYDPDDPDTYYIGDTIEEYRTIAYILFSSSIVLPLMLIFIMSKSKKYYDKKE